MAAEAGATAMLDLSDGLVRDGGRIAKASGVTLELDGAAVREHFLRPPLTDVLEEQTAQALDDVVERFRINWVWMPPWGPERITDDGRDMMRALGFAI